MAGPPPQEQIDGTLAWVTEQFRAYYAAAPPELPPRFTRREFGFIWIGKKFFLRHTGFSSAEAFRSFVVREAPHHAYYSTAYYKTPSAPTMKEKEWLGADLIFDLDADHLPNADEMTFEQQLAEVKKQARKLLHDYLLGDFGFERENVRIVFSGGRGYHFHVNDPRVLQLDSAARREIVDYVSPNETVAASLFEEWSKDKGKKKDKFGNVQRNKEVPAASAPGWNGRITRSVAAFLDQVTAMDERTARRTLMELPGIGEKSAQEIYSRLRESSGVTTPDGQPHRPTDRIRAYGYLEQFPLMGRENVVKALIEQAKVAAPGETDEPVTADIKRLIRLPGSLHGKTGLRVTPLTVDSFETFDPLRDAVALPDAPVRVVVSKPADVTLRGERVQVEPGEQDLPLHVAMFLVLRRSALRPLAAPLHAEP